MVILGITMKISHILVFQWIKQEILVVWVNFCHDPKIGTREWEEREEFIKQKVKNSPIQLRFLALFTKILKCDKFPLLSQVQPYTHRVFSEKFLTKDQKARNS